MKSTVPTRRERILFSCRATEIVIIISDRGNFVGKMCNYVLTDFKIEKLSTSYTEQGTLEFTSNEAVGPAMDYPKPGGSRCTKKAVEQGSRSKFEASFSENDATDLPCSENVGRSRAMVEKAVAHTVQSRRGA